MARPKKLSDDEILDTIESLNVPVVTTKILADRLPMTSSGVGNRLNELLEEEKVGCIAHGSRAQCWWSARGRHPAGKFRG